jgi:tRNA threonylcarbamoyladenosine biosynthesis protein TsaE
MKTTFSLDQINDIAAKIIAQNPHKIIIFNGEMGAGKTTLINVLCKKLGVLDATSSPTFSLVNEYITIEKKMVYHFDFYRIKTENEALDMGVDDYFYSNHYCFIEWAEKIPNLVPEKHSIINISVLENGLRELVLK